MQYISYIARMENQMTMNPNIKMKIARVERGLSQDQLAEQVGAARQTIGLIEKGKYNPSLNLCVRIAKTLGKTLDELFWE